MNCFLLYNLFFFHSLHYKTLESSKHLAVDEAIPGMSVAVFDDSMWQRAEIVSVYDSLDPFVLFVDTGRQKNVKITYLRYLEDLFASSPRKCYKGSLYGVKPRNGESLWPTGAIMMFMLKTKGKKINATIKARVKDFYQLSIVDDVIQNNQVEDSLVELGLAEKETNLGSSMNAIMVSVTKCLDLSY